ncbi:hypothetical protein [Streptomyces sp. bgisy027]|uniref:hypothetical protein n=1 Tax=unclassified Streptomyces TaxID=2593676 RepID=UPI003D75BE18
MLGLLGVGPAPITGTGLDAAARRAADLRVVHGWSPPPYHYGHPGALDPACGPQ